MGEKIFRRTFKKSKQPSDNFVTEVDNHLSDADRKVYEDRIAAGYEELEQPGKALGAYEAAAKACRKHGKTLGVGGIRGELELQRDLVQLGARFIIAGNDTAYLVAAARKDVEALSGLA